MLRRTLVMVVLAAALPAAGFAATAVATSVGPRVGFSVDPNQMVLGGHLMIGGVAPDVTFDPNLELGFGDNRNVTAVNFDLHYHFDIQNSSWRPYVGAGVGANFIELDSPGPFKDASSTEVGGNIIFGAGVPTRAGSHFFTEARFGLGDIPNFKVMAGWNFTL